MLRKYRTGSRLPAGEGRALRKKGGKKVGAANLLASSDQDVDFFIHGVFSYELFGQTSGSQQHMLQSQLLCC